MPDGCSSILTLLGLPGTGKTTLAQALAARAERPTFVLHTDLLKVTLRAAGLLGPGPAWTGDLAERLAVVRPFLAAHIEKARTDGYRLVIEGTLASALPGDLVVRLDASDPLRQARITAKHPSARTAGTADLMPLQAHLATVRVDRVLDASLPTATLASQVEERWA